MAWSKAKTVVLAAVAVALAAGTTATAVKVVRHYEDNDSTWDTGKIDSRILNNAPHIIKIIPSKFPNENGWASIGSRILGLGDTAEDLVGLAYSMPRTRTICSAAIPQEKFDFIVNLPAGSEPAFQRAVETRFRIVTRRETIETNVFFLRAGRQNGPGLKPAKAYNGSNQGNYRDGYRLTNVPIKRLGEVLERFVGVPVIEQTGMEGNFDIDLKWDYQNDPDHAGLKRAVTEQLGMDLVPGTAPVDMLVVEKAK